MTVESIPIPLVDIAIKYRDAGLSVISAKRDKSPAVTSWSTAKTRRPTDGEIGQMFGNLKEAEAVAIVCGAVSGNLECLDFDDAGSAFDAWAEHLRRDHPGLLDRLVMEQSPSGGRHVLYRVDGAPVQGSKKLACRIDGDKYVTLIETRGEGAYFVCAPSPGYTMIQGNLTGIPTIAADERAALFRAAADLDERPKTHEAPKAQPANAAIRGLPGDDYNARGDVRDLLTAHGWHLDHTAPDGNEHWTRPGKDRNTSATLKDVDGIPTFYVFTTSTEFEAGRGYSPFHVYSVLEHDDDFSAAASALAAEGYGATDDDDSDWLEAFLESSQQGGKAERLGKIISEWFKEDVQKPETVISGLIGRGDKLQIVGPSKSRKSWFTGQLALCMATGQDFLTFSIPKPVRVAMVQFEIREEYYFYRVNHMCKPLGIDPGTLDNMIAFNLRGRKLDDIKAELAEFKPDIVFLDPLYKIYGQGHDENSAGDQAAILAKFDHMANALDAAIVYVHHDNKTAGQHVSTVNRGSGSGVTGRDFDASFFLSPHAEDDEAIVVETICRNYPPWKDIVVSWTDGRFIQLHDIPAIPETSRTRHNKAQRGMTPADISDHVIEWFSDGQPIGLEELYTRIKSAFGTGDRKNRSAINLLKERERIVVRRDGPGNTYVAYPI